MRDRFDRRVVSDSALEFIRACQRTVTCHLGGGAALSGAFLSHRLSRDIDLFVHDRSEQRRLVTELPGIADALGQGLRVIRDSGGHVRASLTLGDTQMELDVVHEALQDLEPPGPPLEGVVMESLVDLRASKLTCILSRAEPRDLVDLLFLERAGHAPENDLVHALRKDGGIDPATLSWLLTTFPTTPLPIMLEPLTEAELDAYRQTLAVRMKALAVPRVED